MLIIELKKLVLLGQRKLLMKMTTSIYAVIQRCQSTKLLFFILYCNPKEKDHIKRKLNGSKKNIYL